MTNNNTTTVRAVLLLGGHPQMHNRHRTHAAMTVKGWSASENRLCKLEASLPSGSLFFQCGQKLQCFILIKVLLWNSWGKLAPVTCLRWQMMRGFPILLVKRCQDFFYHQWRCIGDWAADCVWRQSLIDLFRHSVPSGGPQSSFTFDKLLTVVKLFHRAPLLLHMTGRREFVFLSPHCSLLICSSFTGVNIRTGHYKVATHRPLN